jgi:hypothetical protein
MLANGMETAWLEVRSIQGGGGGVTMRDGWFEFRQKVMGGLGGFCCVRGSGTGWSECWLLVIVTPHSRPKHKVTHYLRPQ